MQDDMRENETIDDFFARHSELGDDEIVALWVKRLRDMAKAAKEGRLMSRMEWLNGAKPSNEGKLQG